MPSRRSRILIVLALAILASSSASAGVSCHCFRDRSYIPDSPALADPYILATTRNSLAAAAAGVSKSDVVKMRMTGSGETDLWLKLYLPTLSKERQEKERSKVNAGGDKLARSLAEDVLKKNFGASEEALAALARAGANIAEATLAIYLAKVGGTDATTIYSLVKSEQTSWGSLLDNEDIAPEEVSGLIFKAFK